jgi:DNA-binding CsgD family transcriptional regulator
LAQAPLSAREQEIARCIVEGLTDREIAERLGIKQNTVRTHVEKARAKSGSRNRAQLAAYYLTNYGAEGEDD